MVTTQNEVWANTIKSSGIMVPRFLTTCAITPKPYHMGPFDLLGYNLRLSDIQAAVGLAQMANWMDYWKKGDA